MTETTFAQRAEELFISIAHQDAVSSESAGLVVALAYLDLQVTEEQVVEATRQVLASTEMEFSKDDFVRFAKLLRPDELPSPSQAWRPEVEFAVSPTIPFDNNWPNQPALEAGASSNTAHVSGAEARVEAVAHGQWVFVPMVDLEALDVESRVFAERIYAQVEEDMVSEIVAVVDTELQTFLLTMPRSLPDALQRELRNGWLQQHYVKCVATVVERSASTRWSFQPAVPLDLLTPEEKDKAAGMYNLVDEAVANKIDATVICDFQKVVSTLPGSISSQLKDELRRNWLVENYVKIVERVLNEHLASAWTFSPEVTVEALPVGERALATRMYAFVDDVAAAEIEAAVENDFLWWQRYSLRRRSQV